MPTSATRRQLIPESAAPDLARQEAFGIGTPEGRGIDDPQSFNTVTFPTFDNYQDEVKTLSVRRAGRENAKNISDSELKLLLLERSNLLDKLLSRTINKSETNRLAYVRWSLDRVEDAKNGEQLDILEANISQYEIFLRDLEGLQDSLLAYFSRSK